MIRIFVLLLIIGNSVKAQSNLAFKTSAIQLGIVPGLSINGINPGEYYNLFSINVFTGYGRSTKGTGTGMQLGLAVQLIAKIT